MPREREPAARNRVDLFGRDPDSVQVLLESCRVLTMRLAMPATPWLGVHSIRSPPGDRDVVAVHLIQRMEPGAVTIDVDRHQRRVVLVN